MKLPKKLKSGRRLVATTAEGHIGLYCHGKARTDDADGYRIRLPSGKMTRGLEGSQGYPEAPNDGKWMWLGAKKQRAEVRETKRARSYDDPRSGRTATTTVTSTPDSATQKCCLCLQNVQDHDHTHSTAHPEKGYALTWCCRCVRKVRHSRCDIYDKRKRRAERRKNG